jgi:hypothetical protein
MTGVLTAVVLFAAIAGLIAGYRTDSDRAESFDDAPRRVPNPGPRDLHTVTGSTLARAYVPSWG